MSMISRLAVRSLLGFKNRVSKSYPIFHKSLINPNTFTFIPTCYPQPRLINSKRWHSTKTSHPNFHKTESDQSVLVMEQMELHGGLFPYLIDEKGTMKAFQAPWSNELAFSGDRIHVSNSCNGMVLICFGDSLFLFNPSTRYFVKVLTLDSYLRYMEHYAISMGLCYDESISDYKAVILCFSTCMTPEYYGGHFVIEASLKGKRWTNVSFPFSYLVDEGPAVKGRFHWVVSDSDDYRDCFYAGKKIIRFDPVSNVFEVLPSPPPKSGVENAIVGLGILEGCLCLARRMDSENDFYGDVEVLKMKEYGVAESWTTMFVISNMEVNRYFGTLIPLLMTQNGEVLFCQRREILAYNLETKSYRKYYKIERGIDWMHTVSFVENIASPVGYYWNRVEHEKFGDYIHKDGGRSGFWWASPSKK